MIVDEDFGRVVAFDVKPVTAAALRARPTQAIEPGIYADPATRLMFARCACGFEAAAITVGAKNRGARGLLLAHEETCGYGDRSRAAREKARETAFGKKRP